MASTRSAGIRADVQLATLTSTFRAMLFALPFAFAQALDAHGVEQQIQSTCLPHWVRQLKKYFFEEIEADIGAAFLGRHFLIRDACLVAFG